MTWEYFEHNCNITDLLHREHEQILPGTGVWYGKSGCWHTKTHNISETPQDITKVTINCLYKVGRKLSVAAKMYNFE